VTIAELQPPFKIVERGRGGKFNRIKMIGTYEILEGQGGMSRVEYTYETDAHLPSDVIPEILGGRGWAKRKANKAMKRLRAISRRTACAVNGPLLPRADQLAL